MEKAVINNCSGTTGKTDFLRQMGHMFKQVPKHSCCGFSILHSYPDSTVIYFNTCKGMSFFLALFFFKSILYYLFVDFFIYSVNINTPKSLTSVILFFWCDKIPTLDECLTCGQLSAAEQRPIVSFINQLLASSLPCYTAVYIWKTITLPLSTMMISNLRSPKTSNLYLFSFSLTVSLCVFLQRKKQKSSDVKSLIFPSVFTLSTFIPITIKEPYSLHLWVGPIPPAWLYYSFSLFQIQFLPQLSHPH